MKKELVFLFFTIIALFKTYTPSVCSEIPKYDGKLAITPEISSRTHKGYVQSVENPAGEKFVEKTYFNPDRAINVTNATLIEGNKVWIVPPTSSSNSNVSGYSTRHEHIKGDQNHGIDLSIGITSREQLAHLTENKSLRTIAAKNIFLDDKDCNPTNLFRSKNGTFTVIDRDQAFPTIYNMPNQEKVYDNGTYSPNQRERNIRPQNLSASLTCDFLQTVPKKDLSDQEVKALKGVNKELTRLSSQYPPDQQQTLWINTAKEFNTEYCPSKQKDMRELFQFNAQEVQRTQRELNRLTTRNLSFNNVLRDSVNPSKRAQRDFWNTINS